MRALYLGLAAAFCVAALALKFFEISNVATLIALVIAGVLLVLGLKTTAEQRREEAAAPITLDEEQRATIQAMLDRDDEGAAVRQVQLWFRSATPESARAVVQDLR